jgi:PAS domain S-box-containing protein
MKEKQDLSMNAAELRQRAEAQYHQCAAAEHSDAQSDVDLQRLVYELQVHQIELEMQNEELVRARAEREDILDQFTDLYDFAPVGYFTLDREGKVLRANLTGANLLGVERSKLAGKRFGLYVADGDRADFNGFLQKVFASQSNQACEVALRKKEQCLPGKNQDQIVADGTHPCMVSIEGVCTEDGQTCRVVATDITKRKQREVQLCESEEHYRLLYQRSPQGYQSLDADGNIIEVNQAWLDMLGYTREEVIGHWFGEFLVPEMVEAFRQRFPKYKADGEVQNQYQMVHKDGQIITVAFDGKIGYDLAGNFKQTHCVLRDITEQKRLQDALAENEARFRRLADNAPNIIFRFNIFPEMRLGYISSAVQGITGYSPEECYADPKLLLNLVHPDDHGVMDAILRDLKVPKDAFTVRWIGKDGITRWMESRVVPVRDETGTLLAVEGIIHDLTARFKMQEDLERSESLYRSLVENASNGVMIVQDGVYQYANPAALKLLGRDASEIPGLPIVETIHPESLAIIKQRREKIFIEGVPNPPDATKVLRPDGSTIISESTSIPVSFGGKPAAMVIGQDITDRITAEKALKTSEHFLVRSQRIARMGSWSFDNKTGESTWSDGLYDIYGCEKKENDIPSEMWLEIVHPDDKERMNALDKKVFAGECDYDTEYRIVRQDTHEVRIIHAIAEVVWDDQGVPIQMVGAAQDITDRKQAEEALRKSERNLKKAQWVANIGSWTWHIPANQLEWSDQMYPIFGIDKAEFSGDLADVMARAIHPDDMAAVQASNLSVVNHHKPVPLEYRVVRSDGTQRVVWAEAGELILDEEEKPLMLTGIVQDITERKQAEQELQASEEKFRYVFESANVGKSITSPTGEISVNKTFAEMLGYSQEELARQTWQMLTPPEDIEPIQAKLDLLLKGEKDTTRFDKRYIHKDGSYVWADVSAAIRRDDEGNPLYFITTIINITKRKQAEAKMHLQATALESAANAIVITDCDGNIEWINPAYTQLTGYTTEEILNQNPRILKSGVHDEAFYKNLWDTILSGQMWRSELINKRKDGSLYTEEETITPLIDSNGKILHFIGIKQDISERKYVEEALRESEELFKKLFTEAPMGIALTDSLTGRFIDVNPMYAQIAGRTVAELLAMTWIEITHPDDIEKDAENMVLLNAGKISGFQMEKRFLRPDDSPVWINMTVTPIKMEDRTHRWHLCMIEDISERKQMAVALQEERNLLAHRVEERTTALSRANVELIKALQIKDEFLANMSHELRTPLTAILGISEILEMGMRGPLNEPQIKGVRTIQESGDHLLALINDILDLSKIEAGKLEIEPDLVVVEDVCQASISLIKGMANSKNLTLIYKNSDPQLRIWADSRRVKQTIVNLLSNAVKFTPEGGQINLDVGLDRKKGRVNFVVQDNGIGISQEDIGKLFQPFTQLDSRLSRQYEGSGLGLALVRRLVELHHGEVFVESEGVSGKGSRFTVWLPWEDHLDTELMHALDASEVASPYLTKTGQLKEIKLNQESVILLAEDNAENVTTLSEYLQIFGYQVIHAQDGKEALEKANLFFPDMILLDIQMPVMDGFEVMRRLRQDARFKETPILALTALAMPGDRELCLEAGASDYVTKPVRMKDLLDKIKAAIKTTGEG